VNVVGKNAPFHKGVLSDARAVMLEDEEVQCDAGETPYDGTNAATANCCQNLLDSDCVWALIDAGGIPADVQYKDSSGTVVLTSTTSGPWAIYEDPNTGTILQVGGSGSIAPVSGQSTAVANTDCAPKKQIEWVATANGEISNVRQAKITKIISSAQKTAKSRYKKALCRAFGAFC